VKIMFFVFLSIYSQCDVMSSWATQHTTVCLGRANCLLTGLLVTLEPVNTESSIIIIQLMVQRRDP